MSQARNLRRVQAREFAKRPDFAKAVNSLKGIRPAIDDTQTAVVQVLGELDNVDYEIRKQRAVFLRMVMEVKGVYARKTFVITNESRKESPDPIADVMKMEEQYRFEYDGIFALSRAFMLRQQAEIEES